MPATSDDIARVRRMTNEPTQTTYNDTLVARYIEAWPLVDKVGKTVDDAGWIPAYDLHAASAEIWEEKAAALSVKHDFSADGANYSSNQLYENAMKQAAYHRAKQKAKVKVLIPDRLWSTYYPQYQNPVFDEDQNPDWIDNIV